MNVKLNQVLVIIALLLPGHGASAVAATTSGPGALALAALVADRSPTLTVMQKHEMAQILDGSVPSAPKGYKIPVQADKAICRVSDVDLTARSCTITFGPKTVSLQGRQANELYATIGEAGVPSQGAAGSLYEGITHLSCTIAFDLLRANGGGGASCAFQ
jgi:hypothetical protein